AMVLTGCAGGTDDPGTATAGTDPTAEEPSQQDTDSGHGAIEGAEEVAEPQLHLVSIDRTGAVGMLNLLDGTSTELFSIDPPTAARESSTAARGRGTASTTSTTTGRRRAWWEPWPARDRRS